MCVSSSSCDDYWYRHTVLLFGRSNSKKLSILAWGFRFKRGLDDRARLKICNCWSKEIENRSADRLSKQELQVENSFDFDLPRV